MKKAIPISIAALLLALLVVGSVASAHDDTALRGCTTLIAGQSTTVYGSILYVKT